MSADLALSAARTVGDGPIGYVLKMYPRFSETFIVSEILAREAAGEEIVVYSLRPPADGRFHAELALVKAPVHYLPRSSSARASWRTWSAAPAELRPGLAAVLPLLLDTSADEAEQAVALATLATQHGVRHLHAHFASVATTVARLAGAITGLPYSFTAHAKDIFHEDVDPQDLAIKLREAHHAITISDYNDSHLRRRFGEEACHGLRLVRNGLNLDRFPLRRPPQRDAVARLLGVGRLVEKKGFDLLIQAAGALTERGVPCQVDIVGDGPLRGALEAAIRERGLEDVVTLLGPRTQSEVRRLFQEVDLFVAPFVVGSDGNADGLPTVLLEAMASGVPCVAADVTAVGEVVRDRETGWLVPSGDLPALVDAIADALHPETDIASVVSSARALVVREYDSVRQAARLCALAAAPKEAQR
ncbi:glycosyltransferase [Tessaracoccus caeni]|uniref:glycosyltransferase n=1 Tax=Tessaracoccus caeni TaxID=3031239 RepID=UPI0023DB3E43|nr:glycosyltransferase [Tessaracoccus caeni]MDF1488560.1 glycosyltransferase [Tessaracoccus caeni]